MFKICAVALSVSAAWAQGTAPPPAQAYGPSPAVAQPGLAAPGPVPAASFAAVPIDATPLKTFDPNSPYASPRDAARHRLLNALDKLKADQNIALGVRGIEQSVAIDRDYAVAVYDLGVVCAIAEKWDDAAWAYEEAVRLEPARKASIAPELERIRLLATLGKTPEGAKKIRYDRALSAALQQVPRMTPADAIAAMTEVAKIDSGRWEAAALIAGFTGDTGEYATAVQFLKLALDRAGTAEAAPALRKALAAAQRETDYLKTVVSAESLYRGNKWSESAQSYEAAWQVFPARAGNGLQAATSWLLADDTPHAAAVLARLTEAPDATLAVKAKAMLAALAPIEPIAAGPVPASVPSADPGSASPTVISTMIPDTHTPEMPVLMREPLKFSVDRAPVHLLDALSADPAIAARGASEPLPELPAPTVQGNSPMRELMQARPQPGATAPDVPSQTVSRAIAGKVAREINVTSVPPGASVTVGDEVQPACKTPCILQVSVPAETIRLDAQGYQSASQAVRFGPKPNADVAVTLEAIRGHVIIDTPGAISINGRPLNLQIPFEISVLPGLYDFEIRLADRDLHVALDVRPDSRLRLPVDPL